MGPAAVVTYSTAALAFAALGAVVLRRRADTASELPLFAAALCTALWAAVTAYHAWAPSAASARAGHVLEVVRSTAWLLFLAGALFAGRPTRMRAHRTLQIGVICVGAAVILLGILPALAPRFAAWIIPDFMIFGYLSLAVLGLAMAENLFRNVPSDGRWNLKFLCFGIGAIFGYDFFLYSQALLFRVIDVDLFAARGITNALSMPLLVVSLYRNERAGRALIISHRLAFHSAALLGTGLYLFVMAGAGYYIRQFGGTWGGLLQVVFLFGAFIVLVVSLSSGTVQGYLKTFIGRHFFKYKYDYREEWLRFILTVSEAEKSVQLPERVIQSVCDIVDSPEGGLWLRQADGRYALKAKWNLSRWELNPQDVDIAGETPVVAALQRSHTIVSVDELRRPPSDDIGVTLPPWLAATERAWIIVPLIHHEQLRGFIVLGKPRAPKHLDWEDYDLLKTIGRQAASYLAEYELSEALADARQFEAFNKRFAFVIHDIKNLVSQLSLLVTNAARHRHNAAFQDDMIKTIEGSVEKMKRLLLQLHNQPAQGKPVEIGRLVQGLVESHGRNGATVTFVARSPSLVVNADEERLRRVVGNLLQNAVEAVKGEGTIQIRLSSDGAMAVIEVEDNGPGMDSQFIREKLFRPFKTTKGEGYGIGIYETNEFARAMGGRLDVLSQVGRGTIMKMSLPLMQTTTK